MKVFIFLSLLCLGMASAAPKVDHSAEAQPDLWMVNMVEDTANNAVLEESPEALEKDNQDPLEEQQGIQTAVNASDYMTLQMKVSRRIFDLFKGITRKSVLKKAAKGIGKKIVGEILKPENVGDIVYGIGKQIVGGKKTEESLTTPNLEAETIEEF
ncbi:procathepsin L-like [Glossophaga mutica]